MELKQLTKKLISIPSYVDQSTDEKAIADFIYDYLKNETNLVIKKQLVAGERYNILAFSPKCQKSANRFEIDTLFIDHIDTVQPKTGWQFNQLAGIEKFGKLYGLGAVDTKANVAVLMKLAEIVTPQKYMFLFYVDEEYDFQGIKTFIEDYKNSLQVKTIISLDGENLEIRNACRGLIELDVVCIGKTGHAANPANGKNTIKAFSTIMAKLEKILSANIDENYGKTTMNLAYLRGGLNQGQNDNGTVLGRNGNNIPDYAEATIEFRTNNTITLGYIEKILKQLSKRERITLKIIRVKHNLTPWQTNKENLSSITKVFAESKIKLAYTDAGKSGYVDIALLYETFHAICFCIGAKGSSRHGANEYVEIASLYKLYDMLKIMYNKS